MDIRTFYIHSTGLKQGRVILKLFFYKLRQRLVSAPILRLHETEEYYGTQLYLPTCLDASETVGISSAYFVFCNSWVN